MLSFLRVLSLVRVFVRPTLPPLSSFFFFFNDTATTEIYTLSLHDALPISSMPSWAPWPTMAVPPLRTRCWLAVRPLTPGDRKSTRLNSSHQIISYAVFCLKKKQLQPLFHVPRLVTSHLTQPLELKRPIQYA